MKVFYLFIFQSKISFFSTNIIQAKIGCLYISQNTFLEMKFNSIP